MRTTVVLSRDLVAAVDQIVGARQRSRYVEEAVAEKLRRDRQQQVLDALLAQGGVLNASDHPEWATPEQTSAWVRQLREEADATSMRKIERG